MVWAWELGLFVEKVELHFPDTFGFANGAWWVIKTHLVVQEVSRLRSTYAISATWICIHSYSIKFQFWQKFWHRTRSSTGGPETNVCTISKSNNAFWLYKLQNIANYLLYGRQACNISTTFSEIWTEFLFHNLKVLLYLENKIVCARKLGTFLETQLFARWMFRFPIQKEFFSNGFYIFKYFFFPCEIKRTLKTECSYLRACDTLP